MTDRFYPVGMEVPMDKNPAHERLTILDALQIESFKTLGSIFVVRPSWIDLAVRNHRLRLLVFGRWWLQEITECDASGYHHGISKCWVFSMWKCRALRITSSTKKTKKHRPTATFWARFVCFWDGTKGHELFFKRSMCWPQVLPISDQPLQPSSPWCSFNTKNHGTSQADADTWKTTYEVPGDAGGETRMEF